MDNKDIQNVYENLTSVKAPPPVLESLHRVITELYEVTLLCDEAVELSEVDIDTFYEYPDEDAVDYLHESLDNMIRQEQYEELMAEWYINREKNEGFEF